MRRIWVHFMAAGMTMLMVSGILSVGPSDAGAVTPHRGGQLTVLQDGDVDSLDPGITYSSYGYNVAYATQRPLYDWQVGHDLKGERQTWP